jgi:hypothetical protein
MPPRNGPPGNGRPNPDQDILDQLTLDSFTATPSTVTVGTSESVTLDWHVTEPAVPRARNIRFTLETGSGSFPVGPVGSQSVQVSNSTTFSLIARLGTASADLGNVSITAVPNPACIPITLTAVQIATLATPAVRNAVASFSNKVRLKSDPEWSIDTSGLHVVLHFAVPTGAGVDIDVDVSLTLLPVINNGQLGLTYTNFSVNAHFPWWVNIFAPGVTTIVEQIIDSVITGQLKPQLPGLLQRVVNNLMLPTGRGTIAQIQLQQGQVVATVCPS